MRRAALAATVHRGELSLWVPWSTVGNRDVHRAVPTFTAVNTAGNHGEVANMCITINILFAIRQLQVIPQIFYSTSQFTMLIHLCFAVHDAPRVSHSPSSLLWLKNIEICCISSQPTQFPETKLTPQK